MENKLIGGRQQGKQELKEKVHTKIMTFNREKMLEEMIKKGQASYFRRETKWSEERKQRAITIDVGIDLAISSSGIAIFKNYELEIIQGVRLPKFENTKEWYENAQKAWYRAFNDTLYQIAHRCLVKEKPIEINVKMELSNFSNPKVTQRFAFLAGMIYSSICNLFKYAQKVKTNLYMLNANTWFEQFNEIFVKEKNWTHIPREKRKELSIEEYKKYFKSFYKNKELQEQFETLSKDEQSDIADAFWIGFFDYE